MSAKKRTTSAPPPPPPPRRGCLASFLVTSAIVWLILYVVLLVASRTEGFKYAVSERLNEPRETTLSVGRMWLSPGLTLVMEQITSDNQWTMDGPALQIDEMQLRWYWPGWVLPGHQRIKEVRLKGARWRFVKDDAGAWQPAEFASDALYWAARAGMSIPDPVPPALTLMPEGIRFTVTNGALFWWDGEGGVEMALQGIQIRSDEATLNKRRFNYQELTAASSFWNGRDHGRVERRFLQIDGEPVDL